MRIVRLSRYSWFKLEANGVSLHLDPGYAGYFSNTGPGERELQGNTLAICVSHFHKDHCQPEALARLRRRKTLVVSPRRCVERIGGRVSVLEAGEELEQGSLRIRAIPAHNTAAGRSTRKNHHPGDGLGYRITWNGWTFYHAGDTDLLPEMELLGTIDVAFLPIGGTFTMDAEEALRAARTIRPRIVVPMHELHADPLAFAKTATSRSRLRAVVLNVGEGFAL